MVVVSEKWLSTRDQQIYHKNKWPTLLCATHYMFVVYYNVVYMVKCIVSVCICKWNNKNIDKVGWPERAVAVKVVEMAVFVVLSTTSTGICVGSGVRHESLLGIVKDLLLFGLHHVWIIFFDQKYPAHNLKCYRFYWELYDWNNLFLFFLYVNVYF